MELIERHIPNKIGGGIGFCVKNSVSCKLRYKLTICDDHCESLFIEIESQYLGNEGICCYS